MLAPGWFRVPLGPWIRGERDKRLYFLLFRPDAYIHGVHRYQVLSLAHRIEATQLPSDGNATPRRATVVVFRNAVGGDADRYFPTFLGQHDLLRKELIRMTRSRYVPPASRQPHIAIHVRLGDFSSADRARLRTGVHSARLPLTWYIDMLRGIRNRLSHELAAVVYSDGEDREIAPLLELPRVARAAEASAITHMLAMSQASLLIGTGSGMSIWGSFLGQVPRLCYPGQRLLRTINELELEPECEVEEEIPENFIRRIVSRIHTPQ